MFKISHRGNLTGPNIERENTISYVEEALNDNYSCEVDLWLANNTLFFGHDEPQYLVPKGFLEHNKDLLWIHCKNLNALDYLTKNNLGLNFFWHQNDDFTLTSKGFIWTFPGKPTVQKSVLVNLGKPSSELISLDISGLCSDYISFFK
jgi:hypothetical protein